MDRAGQIRKNTANTRPESMVDEDESDASSEDEEYDQIDSDDVDSDELDDEPEELIGGAGSSELSQQQDYIRL